MKDKKHWQKTSSAGPRWNRRRWASYGVATSSSLKLMKGKEETEVSDLLTSCSHRAYFSGRHDRPATARISE